MKRRIFGLMIGMQLALVPFVAAHAEMKCGPAHDGKQDCTGDNPEMHPHTENCSVINGKTICKEHEDHQHNAKAQGDGKGNVCVTKNGTTTCGPQPKAHRYITGVASTTVVVDDHSHCVMGVGSVRCTEERPAPYIIQTSCVSDASGNILCPQADAITLSRSGIVSVNTWRPVCITNVNGQIYCTTTANFYNPAPDQLNCEIGLSGRIGCYRIEPATGEVCISSHNVTACYDPNYPGNRCEFNDQTMMCSGMVSKTYAGIEPSL